MLENNCWINLKVNEWISSVKVYKIQTLFRTPREVLSSLSGAPQRSKCFQVLINLEIQIQDLISC